MIRERRTITPSVPALGDVQQDPAILGRVPVAVIVELRRQVSHLAADLEAAFCRAVAEHRRPDQAADVSADRLLTPAVAATRFGVTKRWLLAHASEIPVVTRLSRKTIRFSERRLARYMDKPPV